jgi:uncharacterized repeat protein (TIGR01451 family)
VAGPKLDVNSTVDSLVASVGDSVTVNITITNPGSVTLVDAQVENNTPPGLAFQNASGGGTYDAATQDVGWQISGLPPGASESVSFTVQLGESGAWVSTVCVDGLDALGNHASACEDVTVITPGVPTPTPTPVATASSTPPPGASTLTPAPGTPTLTPHLAVLGVAIRRLEERAGQRSPVQVPVQLPGRSPGPF